MDLHSSGIGDIYQYMGVEVSWKCACKRSVCLVFCLPVRDRDTRVLLKRTGFRHVLLCEAAVVCVGAVLPLATGMHLHGGENKQKCILGTQV